MDHSDFRVRVGDKDSIFHKYRYHNPFWRAGANYNSYRSYLFTTYDKKVPGGFAKIITALTLLGFLYGGYRMHQFKEEKGRMKVVSYEYKRKATPFLQAIEDRRWLAAQQRSAWLRQELFKHNPEELLALERIYNDPMMFEPGKTQGYLHYLGIQKSYKNRSRHYVDVLRGHDKYRQNVPTEHF